MLTQIEPSRFDVCDPADIDAVRRVFSFTTTPANVRVARRMAGNGTSAASINSRGWRRRMARWALGSPLLPHTGLFIYTRDGQSTPIRFNGRNLEFNAIYEPLYRHGYELETALLLTRLCRGDSAFFDVGSNWGYFSLLMAAQAEFSGPIFAFEPNPRAFADLQDTIQQADLNERIHACPVGLGSRRSQRPIYEVDPFNTGAARLGSGAAIDGEPSAQVERLDDLPLPDPAFIKIDAQGMEADILAGARTLLTTARPMVIFESFLSYATPTQTCGPIDLLQSMDYRIFAPALIFTDGGHDVLTTYGHDTASLLLSDAAPRLGLFETDARNRYMLGTQLNLLAVPSELTDEVWSAGILDLSR